MIIIDKVEDLNLHDSITCGQIFRFSENEDKSYTVVLSDRVINIKQDKDKLIVKSNNYDNLENVIIKYLDLKTDYNKINKILLKSDNMLEDAIKSSKGLKMIRQEPFEAVIEYIISQNNRVYAIRNSMNLIAQKYGDKIEFEGEEYYLFPNAEKLKDVTIEEFRQFKVGFRDKYIYNMVQAINKGEINLNEIHNLETEKAMEKLMANIGVGPKVASCILLFAYGRFDVFPIDTWVKKYMFDLYGINSQKEIAKIASEKYGKYCGLAIQYMYHSKRNSNG